MTLTAIGDAIALGGAIDEAAGLAELPGRAREGRLVLDLAAVTFINSLGVRDWIRMLRAAERAGIAVELRRVAEPIVQQLNMIVATRGAAVVASCYAPYACEACGHEESCLIDLAAHLPALQRGAPPALPCPACGAAMAFHDFAERYFAFLSV
jgi:anti-anti-sigma regulatory factor